ncbi:hypothetical protein PtrSN002B_006930 [Pyrenophora tritici-repentis]|uniref:Atrophin-1 domain containing protein n=2 Tax=Pyrenophora tritici-repentis TaxID=45151 RepID=A0A2W1HM07_9PLEO|nr:uncharacterized protein PTRG_05225 [Pyrenophora tritici-repentis Pt-1C-BFP]KAA8611605.1 hypothetical protein PtrV1_13481 [Pyrenophora tritici-repentis]EDU48132.1 hypothetical protein PTRG_05225 [Pyrenophora tritici-repentis Pt-1C-BFP]KAF7447493.1 hypothetical protein A1F99_089400 [Pyrenophora tritici-repentis]KAF7569869.1 Atrophin-1 domain containing protein [Pyrenophora tritici-repentis]KAG9382414.1 hypothetical protein A1F94_006335 [Pyrenophora tritici-repentis]
MSSTSSAYHIPFPKTFLAVNTPVKQAVAVESSPTESVMPAHGFLSNRSHRHESVSSLSSFGAPPSEASTISAPSSPRTSPADSQILGPKIFAPLAVNAKYEIPPNNVSEMSVAERKRRMSFEKHTFLSNKH